jgi:phage gp45-like
MNGDIDIFRERRLREEMKEYVRQQTRNVVQFTRMTKNTPSGKGDQVHGHRVEGADASDYDYPVRRMQHFGLRSLPPAGVWVVRVGGVGGNAVIVAEESDRFGPTNLNDGEVCIYNKVNGCTILLDQNGAITINAANGQTVNVNGNGHPLPVWDTFEADLKAALATIPKAASTAYPGLSDSGTLMTTLTAKLGNSSYESTKAKNG